MAIYDHSNRHEPTHPGPWPLAGQAQGLVLPADLLASGDVTVQLLAAELGASCDRANFVARLGGWFSGDTVDTHEPHGWVNFITTSREDRNPCR